MTEHLKDLTTSLSGDPPSLEERLLARYGRYLEGEDLTEAQRKECLLALWQIMSAFADYGFSLKAGDKFTSESDHGMDDVLRYLIPEETAPETVASPNTANKEEPE
ncbi:hypothetical protein [Roseobacter sp. MH60115]|uniref:hypothetical protein n=1 Tax=Roseobacter sp. MH60115 TaxID=2785324 RepID=UPI0018A2DA2A|nr:hypothetical protein [Roseobacter sp. MH60115]